MAVSLTTTINTGFGSKVLSESTGAASPCMGLLHMLCALQAAPALHAQPAASGR